MKLNKFLKYKKALVLGTGGGNDIVSATLIADYLSNCGIECDVAGILSPGAIHTFDGKNENVINEIRGDVRRYINSKEKKEISFIDSMLPNLTKDLGYKVGNFYDFSTKFGTSKLEEEICNLVTRNNYDFFLEVDVGGDILARKKDKTLLSPLMDFTSLYLLDKIPIDSYLVEFGLGSDGELRPDAMNEILKELEEKNILIDEDILDKEDCEIIKFRELFKRISNVRKGHTGTILLKTLEDKNGKDLNLKYRSSWKINKKKWFNEFEIVIPQNTFGKVYFFDGKRLVKERGDTAIKYGNSLEQFIKVKSVPEWKTELDLCYLDNPSGIYCLTPSLNVPEQMREEIIVEGLLELDNGNADKIIILRKDKKLIGGNYVIHDSRNYSLISNSKFGNASLINKIRKYENGKS